MSRLERVLASIDAINAQDPRTLEVNGERTPVELIYGQRMSARLAAFAPTAVEELQIAARAQHIARWRSPRSDYPEGRVGYKRWRSELSRMHADLAGELMAAAGYPETAVDWVGRMIRKQDLRGDAAAQTLEDVACLVFIEHYLSSFLRKHQEAKVVEIVGKTWRKMSTVGQGAARLLVPSECTELFTRVLGPAGAV